MLLSTLIPAILLGVLFLSRFRTEPSNNVAYEQVSFPSVSSSPTAEGEKPISPLVLVAPIVLADDEGLRDFAANLTYHTASLSALLSEIGKNDPKADKAAVPQTNSVSTLRKLTIGLIEKRVASLQLLADRWLTGAQNLSESGDEILEQKKNVDDLKEGLLSLSAEAQSATSSGELRTVYQAVLQKEIFAGVLPKLLSARFLSEETYLLSRIIALSPGLSDRVNNFPQASVSATLQEGFLGYQQHSTLLRDQSEQAQATPAYSLLEDILGTLNKLREDIKLIIGLLVRPTPPSLIKKH